MRNTRSFIPHLYSGMDGTPFHPFCSQGQNEQNIANAFCTNHSHSRIVNKKNALLESGLICTRCHQAQSISSSWEEFAKSTIRTVTYSRRCIGRLLADNFVGEVLTVCQ